MIYETGSVIVCNLSNGDMQLSAHFKLSEFACKDGTQIVFVGDELLDVLEDIREHFNKPVIINSGYRTVNYNKKIGGVAHSRHCMGIASDIHIDGITPKEIYNYLDISYPNCYGIGLYNSFVHIDTRNKKARWNNSK